MAENDLAVFYKLTKIVNVAEELLKDTKEKLINHYDMLVFRCPHSEAVDRKSSMRGVGVTRRCKICGITDYASEGGSPGDVYDYGYPGHPSRSFWEGAEIEEIDDHEFNKYGRTHEWVVQDSKPRKRFT